MKERRAAWTFVAPALIVIGAFFLAPVVAAFALSLTDFDLYALADLRNLRFVGLGNYVDILKTPLFWKSLGNTFYFVLVGVPLSIAVSLGAALLLDSKLARFKGFFRTALFAPVDWLGDPHWSMPAIILFAVWKNFGYNMIILLAALQGIPRDLYEAAHIDGASALQRLRHITLPMLRPALLLVSVITVSGYFQLFAEPYVMTRGNPLQSTVSVLYFMYEEGFTWWSLGRASAIAFLLFALILAATLLLLRWDRRGETA